MSPGYDERAPRQEGPPNAAESVSHRLEHGSDTTAPRLRWPLLCPCGCEPDRPFDCVTTRPIPGPGFCACSTLGIEHLRTWRAVRFHRLDHPADWFGGAA
jgi:hypothetical protein